jgi:CheY-like chemotaxis protein
MTPRRRWTSPFSGNRIWALSDIDMGPHLARRLRANEQTRHIVLIAVTARGTVEETRHALAAGYKCHVLKPVQPEKLLAMVKACLEWI